MALQVKAQPPRATLPKVEEVKGPPDLYGAAMRSATTTTAGLAGVLALGFVSPSSAFSSMFTKFGLSSICGYQVAHLAHLRFDPAELLSRLVTRQDADGWIADKMVQGM